MLIFFEFARNFTTWLFIKKTLLFCLHYTPLLIMKTFHLPCRSFKLFGSKIYYNNRLFLTLFPKFLFFSKPSATLPLNHLDQNYYDKLFLTSLKSNPSAIKISLPISNITTWPFRPEVHHDNQLFLTRSLQILPSAIKTQMFFER